MSDQPRPRGRGIYKGRSDANNYRRSDDDDRGTQAGTWTQPAPGFKRKPIREQLDTPIDPEGDCCVLDGKPCILYSNWDYGEDWSGEFVREVHPFMLLSATKVTPEEFWKLVRTLQEK